MWKQERGCNLNLLPRRSYNECNKTSFFEIRNTERLQLFPTLISFQVNRCSTSWLQKFLSMRYSDCPICFLLFAVYKGTLVCLPIYHHFLIFYLLTRLCQHPGNGSSLHSFNMLRNILIKYFWSLSAVWTPDREAWPVRQEPVTPTHSTSIKKYQ